MLSDAGIAATQAEVRYSDAAQAGEDVTSTAAALLQAQAIWTASAKVLDDARKSLADAEAAELKAKDDEAFRIASEAADEATKRVTAAREMVSLRAEELVDALAIEEAELHYYRSTAEPARRAPASYPPIYPT